MHQHQQHRARNALKALNLLDRTLGPEPRDPEYTDWKMARQHLIAVIQSLGLQLFAQDNPDHPWRTELQNKKDG